MVLNWFGAESVGYAVLVLSAVATLGLTLGSLRIFNVNLGIAGVLFTGLLFGHLGIMPSAPLIEFFREFGLILFVYTVGMQLGPGFFSSFKKDGLRLNLLACGIVLGGFAIAAFIHFALKVDGAVTVGLFSGATTNTPSLAAAQQMLKGFPGVTEETLKLPTTGYAVAYPFGILGIILVISIVKSFFKIAPDLEAREFENRAMPEESRVAAMTLLVTNSNLDGVELRNIPALAERGVVSRILHAGHVFSPTPDTVLHRGDAILIVSAQKNLDEIRLLVGSLANVDLRSQAANLLTKRIVVTRKRVLGKSLAELNLSTRYGVNITRIIRTEVEIAALPSLRIQFGDVLLAVGEEEPLNEVAKEFGNSAQTLNHPQLISLFLGIASGILLGNIPFSVPGLPVPVKLGFAGGPLVMAILLSNIGRVGTVVWYMPPSANFILRETGIVMFLAAVGMHSGDRFVGALLNGQGFYWILLGAMITFVPLVVTAFLARAVYRLNFVQLCGLMAGSMTDPPALAFANSMTSSNAPSIAYAAVYPLTMLLRIVLAQTLVALFMF